MVDKFHFHWAAAQNVGKAPALSTQDLLTACFYGARVGIRALAHAGLDKHSAVKVPPRPSCREFCKPWLMWSRKASRRTCGYKVGTSSLSLQALPVLPITAIGTSQRELKSISSCGHKGRTHQRQSRQCEQHSSPPPTSQRQTKSYCSPLPHV